MHKKKQGFVLLAAFLTLSHGAAFALAHPSRGENSFIRANRGGWAFSVVAAPLEIEKCKSIRGGDVNMILNAARTTMTVRVIENDAEGRMGKIPPSEEYDIQVHNRLVCTILAPFMPTDRSRSKLGSLDDLSTRPMPFPAGTWNITDIVPRDDQYGPYMIRTNAVGSVDVFRTFKDSRGPQYMGTYEDTGYGIHANTVPFQSSRSYGCIVANQEDIIKLVNTINKDRAEDSRSTQRICVRPEIN